MVFITALEKGTEFISSKNRGIKIWRIEWNEEL
jgi:hypothetical protein